MTGVELRLILDVHTYHFIKKRISGSVSNVAQRYSKANNDPI